MVRGGRYPPRCVVKRLVCSTHCHNDSEDLVDYREGDCGLVVGTMTFGVMMVDMLFHDGLTVMTLFVIAIMMAVPVAMAIPVPAVIPVAIAIMVIPIPVTVRPAMVVAVPVWTPLALVPPVMMPMGLFLALMITFLIVVPFALFTSVVIGPGVAAYGQCESDQCYAYDQDLPCHVNLLRIGLRAVPFGLFNPYDERGHLKVYIGR